MIKHYLKTAIRNILKDKVYSIINILGLSIGLSCSFFMLIYVLNELRYDRMHEKQDNIYRVICEKPVFKVKEPSTPLIFGPTIKEEYPEISKYTRIRILPKCKIKNGTQYEVNYGFYCTDNEIFDIFTFHLMEGDKTQLLTNPNSVVISEKTAKKYFGDVSAYGKILSIKTATGKKELKITGVFEDFSKYSTFKPELLGNLDLTIDDLNNGFDGAYDINKWDNDFFTTYLLLNENASIADLQKKMPDFEQRHCNKENPYKFSFQPLTDIYLHSEGLVNNNTACGDYKSVRLFSLIALLILFIAGINYIILSTARAVRRTKEIGMRKVFGANKAMLVRQVLSESVLVTFIALPLAILFVKVFLPYVNKLFDKELVFTLSESGSYLAGFAMITFFIGILSGSYLSVYLARLQPIAILRNKVMNGNRRNYFRKSMVVFQLIIFILLSMSTAIVYRQLQYVHHKDMGFNKENLLIINCDDFGEKYLTFKNEIKANTNIVNACGSMFLPPAMSSMTYPCPRADNPNEKVLVEGLAADYDFVKTFEIKIVQGNDYTGDSKADSGCCLMNETAIRELVIKNPVNYQLSKSTKIIGVVKDFNFHSIHSKIPSLQIDALSSESINYVSQVAVRIKPGSKTESIGFLKNKWKEFSKEPFDYYFIDDMLDEMFKKEQKQAKIMRIFSLFAIFIAMLGLFGLSLYTSQQRTREIGIRKVHGASIGDIMRLLSKEYLMLVLIANILAAPIAYYFMNKWLKDFAYHTAIEWWLFILMFILSLAIVLLTISFQAFKAAKTNPVITLKYE